MKVCILSMQRVGNFGSLLQAYALKRTVEKMGHEIHFIDIEKRNEDNDYVNVIRKSYSNEYENIGKITAINKLKKIDKYAINRIRIKLKEKKQEKYFEEFRKDILKIDIADNNDTYDYCIIGSDEVFNALADTSWGFTTQLFGNVVQTDKILTYASSCGSTSYQMLNENMKKKIAESFSNIIAFSVRDQNTADFIKGVGVTQYYEHLDPVVMYNFINEVGPVAISVKLPRKFCIVYSYYNRIHLENEIISIKKFCENHNLEIIALGAPQKWISKYYAVKPFEMLKIFSLADMVITDTFHGTIFSAKFSKHFATLERESNKNKLNDLLIKLEITNHRMESFDELECVYHADSEVNRMHDIQKLVYKDSTDYFDSYLKENHNG